MGLVQTANKVYWRHFVFFRVFFVSLLCTRVGGGGTSTSLKVWFGEKSGKICENLRKIN